jgi:general stress protein YciG
VSDPEPKRLTGFAAMSRKALVAASAKGGRKSWELGRAQRWTKETAKEAGSKGGLASAAAKKENP